MTSGTYGDGWAVADDHGLRVETVRPDRRSALLCWLVLIGVGSSATLANYSDAEIEYLWKRYGNGRAATVHRVTVKVTSV